MLMNLVLKCSTHPRRRSTDDRVLLSLCSDDHSPDPNTICGICEVFIQLIVLFSQIRKVALDQEAPTSEFRLRLRLSPILWQQECSPQPILPQQFSPSGPQCLSLRTILSLPLSPFFPALFYSL